MPRFRAAIVGGIILVTVVFILLLERQGPERIVNDEPPEIDPLVSESFDSLARSANEVRGAEVELDVIFEGAAVERGRVLTYTYTVANIPDRPFDPRIVRMARKQLNRESCADRIIRSAVDGGGVVRYVYLGPGGSRILVIDVDRQSCLAVDKAGARSSVLAPRPTP